MTIPESPGASRWSLGPGLGLGISVGWIPVAFAFDGVTVLLLPVQFGSSADAASSIGLISAGGLALAAVALPLAGVLSDRWRQSVDRRAFLALAVIPLLGGLWILAGAGSVLIIGLGYVLLQLGASAMQAGLQTLIPEHVEAPARGRAGGLKAMFDVGGAFLAFTVLGATLAAGGPLAAAGATTIVVLGAVALAWFLVPPVAASLAEPRPSGMLALPPGFLRVLLARFLFLVGTFAVGRFLLLLVSERMGIGPAQAVDEAAWLLALLTLTTAAIALPAGLLADRWGREPVMLGGAALSAVGIAALIPAAGIAGILAGGLLMSLGTAAFVSANWAATTDLAPARDAGRLMGISGIATIAAAAFAGLIGPIVDAFGFSPAMAVASVAAATALVPLMSGRRPRLAPLEETA